MIGFVRRFDSSYLDAKEKIDAGLIGQPIMIRSQTVDLDNVSDFQIKYARQSGGIFHDYNIHDIDLTRWLLGSEIQTVYSLGGAFKYRDFSLANDGDHVISQCKLENGLLAVISASRIAAHGHDTYTEITGTEGSLRIGRPSNKNRVEILDKHGIRQESVTTFWERFSHAFQAQVEHFIESVKHDIPVDLDISNALRNTAVATAMTHSYHHEKVIHVAY